MIKNLLKTALRIFWREKFYTLINVFGLSIGLAICIIIYLYIDHERSYDKHQTNLDRMYRVVSLTERAGLSEKNGITAYPLVPTIKPEVSGIERIARVVANTYQVSYEQDVFEFDNIIFTSYDFTKIFDVELLSGNPEDLDKPYKVFLTEKTAKTIFGTADPIGKSISFNGYFDMEIAGLIKDSHQLTHLPFTMLISGETYKKVPAPFEYDNWGTTLSGFYSYVLLEETATKEDVETSINNVIHKNVEVDEEFTTTYFLQAVADIHFDYEFGNDNEVPVVNVKYLLIFGVIGVFILILAGINFVNLSITQVLQRRKEVGVRKVNGARRAHIIWQMIFETLLIIVLTTIFSILLTEVLLPHINSLLGEYINLELYGNLEIFVFILLLMTVVTLLTGLFPALSMSKYNPAAIIKQQANPRNTFTGLLRNFLILFQFIISVALIVSTLIVGKQLSFIQEKELGFQSANILNLPLPENDAATLSLLKNELLRIPNVQHVSFAMAPPTSSSNISTTYTSPYLEDSEPKRVNVKCIDKDYLETFKLELVAGEWWKDDPFARDTNAVSTLGESARETSDELSEYVVNETFVKEMGYPSVQEIIGEKAFIVGNDGIIIGVVKDFHMATLHHKTQPVLFAAYNSLFFNISIELNAQYTDETLTSILNTWKEVFPESLGDYRFYEDSLARMYEEDNRTLTMIRVASWVAIIIAALGLLGISAYTISLRTKEIGIRKVLGSGILQIALLMNRNYMILVLLANIIAFPLSFMFARKWLENFAYKVAISPFEYVLAFVLSIGLSFVIISFHAIKTSRRNPLETLRYE